METEIKDGFLTIKLPAKVKDLPLSKSEKSRIVASTRGNLQTSMQVGGKNVVVSVNAYIGV